MGARPQVRPTSRKAWRDWLAKHHASSSGVWLVYAKKHSQLPSLIYNDAVAGVKAANSSGSWDATKHVEELKIPPDLARAIKANPDARRNWGSYSASRRKGVLYRLAGARRPETRARCLQEIIWNMARNMSHAERMERAGFRPKPKPSRSAKP